jgi:catechol 2,3-dioxygenase-like lactoylglutathione lyase family enzyme
MIGYVTIGSNDFEAAVDFYDELLATINVNRLWKHGTMAAWGPSRQQPSFCVVAPFDGRVATVGNGVMVALKMANREQVNAIHAKSIELGGTDEGKPGPRGDHGFYGGYFRELDGNKLNAYVPA